jgi:hypothetical protein
MRRWGYVTFTSGPVRGKRPGPDALIAPTARGVSARDTWPEAIALVERRWRERPGFRYDVLSAALDGLVSQLDPALPDCLPILGFGLYSRRDPAREARWARSGPAAAGPGGLRQAGDGTAPVTPER